MLDANVTLASLAASSSTVHLAGDVSTALTAVSLYATTLDGPGTLTNAAGTTLDLFADTLNLDLVNDGSIVVQAYYSYLNGTLTTATGSAIELTEGSPYAHAILEVARGFTNHGLIDLNSEGAAGASYYAEMDVNGTLTNALGGTIRSSDDSGLGGGRYLGVTALDNAGTIDLSQAGLVWTQSGQSTNSGTIDVIAGGLSITGGGLTNTGIIDIAPGRTLTFSASNGGTFDDSAGAITNAGDLALNNTTAMLDANVTLASLAASSSTVSLAGDVSTADTAVSLYATTLDGPGTLTNAAGTTLDLFADTLNLDLVNDGSIVVQAYYSYLNGTLTTATGSAIELTEGSPYAHAILEVARGFTNHGLIDLNSEGAAGASYYAEMDVNGTLTDAHDGTIRSSDDSGLGGGRSGRHGPGQRRDHRPLASGSGVDAVRPEHEYRHDRRHGGGPHHHRRRPDQHRHHRHRPRPHAHLLRQ